MKKEIVLSLGVIFILQTAAFGYEEIGKEPSSKMPISIPQFNLGETLEEALGELIEKAKESDKVIEREESALDIPATLPSHLREISSALESFIEEEGYTIKDENDGYVTLVTEDEKGVLKLTVSELTSGESYYSSWGWYADNLVYSGSYNKLDLTAESVKRFDEDYWQHLATFVPSSNHYTYETDTPKAPLSPEEIVEKVEIASKYHLAVAKATEDSLSINTQGMSYYEGENWKSQMKIFPATYDISDYSYLKIKTDTGLDKKVNFKLQLFDEKTGSGMNQGLSSIHSLKGESEVYIPLSEFNDVDLNGIHSLTIHYGKTAFDLPLNPTNDGIIAIESMEFTKTKDMWHQIGDFIVEIIDLIFGKNWG